MSLSPYRAQQPINVADLEGRLPLAPPSRYLRNEILVPAEEKTIVYVGEVFNLIVGSPECGYLPIHGDGKLSRYDRIERSKKKLVCWFLPKYQLQTSSEDKTIWVFENRFYMFLIGGKLSIECKNGLKKEALKKGVTVSDKLLELVFGPIDTEIMGMYQELHKKLTSTAF